MKHSDLIVILGASENPLRPSYLANKLLRNKGYRTHNIALGNESSNEVLQEEGEKTITIFLKPNQQKKYYNYVLSLKPAQIIFNPGSENEELKALATKNNIKVLSGCTIALLMNSII